MAKIKKINVNNTSYDIDATYLGGVAADGYVKLENNKIPTQYLPAYVDDVLEYDTYSDLPESGSSGVIYVVLDTNKTYRWAGRSSYDYVEISPSLALGTTHETAACGDHKHTVAHKPAGSVTSTFSGTEAGHTHSFSGSGTASATASGSRTSIYSITGVGELPSASLSEGTLPTATLSKGTLPSATFDAGTLPSATFSAGTLPSATLNKGTLPTHTFAPGSLPTLTGTVANQCLTLTFSGGTAPSSTFSAGTLPSLTFNAGTLPGLEFSAGTLPDLEFSAGTLPGLTFNGGAFPTLTFDPGSLPTRSSAISVAKGDHTHSASVSGTTGETKLTPAGTVSSTFDGTSATLTTSTPTH